MPRWQGVFYGRRLRGELPGLRTSIDVEGAIKQRDKVRDDYLIKGNKRTSPVFKVDDLVWIHNRDNGLWDIPGTVVEVWEDNRSYYIQPDKGTKKLRNRRFLIRRIPQKPSSADAGADATLGQQREPVGRESGPAVGPRHSPRLANQMKVTFKVELSEHDVRTRVLSGLDRKEVHLGKELSRVVRSSTKDGRDKHKTRAGTGELELEARAHADRVPHPNHSLLCAHHGSIGGPGNTSLHLPEETGLVLAHKSGDKCAETLVGRIPTSGGVKKAQGILTD